MSGQFEDAEGEAQRIALTPAPTEHTSGGTRFRPRYRKLEPQELKLHDAIKAKADELLSLIESVTPVLGSVDPNRERGANVMLAIRHLEDAVYRAIKGLTA